MALDIGNEVDEQNGILFSVLLCPHENSQGALYFAPVCLFVHLSHLSLCKQLLLEFSNN